MTNLLDQINSPRDLKKLGVDQLSSLAEEIRQFITHSVSLSGGHLASNLGVIEITLALHYVFDFESDKLLWDVGHQCYAHKVLTGRKEMFGKLRQRDGLSGFPNPEESVCDPFSVGHAGTSIATALGMALGAQHNKTDEKIVALIGDASIVNGTSFEGLNNLGLLKRQMLVVLNDNSMAIDVSQGSIAKFLAKIRLSHTYDDMRKTANNILEHLPLIGKKMEGALEHVKKTIRMAVTSNKLFESMNIPYFGPVDGHDIGSLVKLFREISHLDRPAILHVYTRKGKGFTPADDNPCKYHSTGPFEINGQTAESNGKSSRSFTEAFGDGLTELGQKDKRVIAITAAMPDGTGLVKFRNRFPDRYYDVGIAEGVAVDIAAGLAKQGHKPVVCIYSTFLQRGIDHVFQEVSLQNLPVIFCVDRAGLVGNDGPTHHGMLDIGYMRMLPNMVVIAPADEAEMKAALEFSVDCGKPVTIRYPKDKVPKESVCVEPTAFEMGKSVTLKESDGPIVIAAIGSVITEAVKAAKTLAADGIDVGVINARFAKPIDEKIILLAQSGKTVITVEDHSLACGFGSAILEEAAKAAKDNEFKGKIINLASPDEFIRAGTRKVQMNDIGIDADNIVRTVKKLNV